MRAHIRGWKDRMDDGARRHYEKKIATTYAEDAMEEEIAELRAALAQTEANSDDISAHLAAMTETASKYRTLAQKEAAAPGDLHAAIMALKWIEPKDINEDAEDDTELSAHRDGWIECRSAAAELVRAALAQPVAVDAPSEDDMSVLKRLAFRTLWLAFRWNDHNFKAAHIEAREACARVGIVTDDQADEWLEHGKLPPIVLRDDPDAKGATTCKWTLDDWESGTWKSSCGELWSFIDGGPQDNRVSYCHHCGSKVAIDAQDGEAT